MSYDVGTCNNQTDFFASPHHHIYSRQKSQNSAIFSLFTHFGVVSIKKQIVFFRDGDFMWFCVVSKNRTFLHLSDYYASWDAVPYDGTYEWILSIHRSFVWVKKITILSKLSTTTNPIDSRIYHEKKTDPY